MNTHVTLEPLKDFPLHGRVGSHEALLQLPAHQQREGHCIPPLLTGAEQSGRSHYRTPLCLSPGKPRYAGLPGERQPSKEDSLQPTDCAFTDRAGNILIKGNWPPAGGLPTFLHMFLAHLQGIRYSENPLRPSEVHTGYPYQTNKYMALQLINNQILT